MVEISLGYVQTKVDELRWRIKLAALAFVQTPNYEPVIKLRNGAYIDLNSKKIVLPEDTHIHCKGNLKLTSDKHVIVKSGRTPEPEREGYMYSVWTNSDEDELGRPIKKQVKPCDVPNCLCCKSKKG